MSEYRYGCVYVGTCQVNGKQYVGQTICKNPKDRFKSHKTNATNGGKQPLHLAIRKYGFKSFSFEVIDYADSQEELDLLEDYYIVVLNTLSPSGYNLKRGGARGKHSILSIENMRAVHNLPEVKDRHSKAMTIIMARPEVQAKHVAVRADREFQIKHAEATKIGLADPIVKQRHIDGIRTAYERPEVIERLSNAIRGSWQNQDIRERRIAGIKQLRWWRTPDGKTYRSIEAHNSKDLLGRKSPKKTVPGGIGLRWWHTPDGLEYKDLTPRNDGDALGRSWVPSEYNRARTIEANTGRKMPRDGVERGAAKRKGQPRKSPKRLT
jgi:group I intron endonuclease